MATINEAKELASRLLKVESSELRSKSLPDGDATYVWTEGRGGFALVVAADGSVLYANSSVDPEVHMQAFRDGRRTPLEQFES